MKKKPEDNANCFLHAAHALIESHKAKHTKKDEKLGAKFNKYCERMYSAISGQYGKCPNTHQNLVKMS